MYDLIIIGAGSAGYPAGMYASRYKLKNLIIGGQLGGALATSHQVENYPGTISASGKEIMDNFRVHAEKSGSKILQEMVESVEKNKVHPKGIANSKGREGTLGQEDHFLIKTGSGKEFKTKYAIIATGNNYRKLGAKGEIEFIGKGVSYCATCDGMFFKNRDVVMVGGGNSALTESLYLAEICNKVYLVHRRDTFRAEDSWVDKVKQTPNIELVLNEEVEEITGKMFVEEIILKSGKTLKADGIFIAVGSIPNTKVVDNLDPEKDNEGCLIVDKKQETSIKGLYAAGDITTASNKFKQTIMSAAEGCLAANSVHEEHLK